MRASDITRKKLIKSFLVFVIALTTLALFFVVSGCNREQATSGNKVPLKQSASSSNEQKKSAKAQQANPIQNTRAEQSKPTAKQTQAKMTTIKLYFCDDQGENLVAEIKQVIDEGNLPKSAVEALIKGPTAKNLVPVIPEGTKLLNLDIIRDTAYVNFSKELVEKHWGGSAMELFTVQSIVNTLTEFENIKKVQIMVDGKIVETIAGHVDISKPLTRDDTLIQAEP